MKGHAELFLRITTSRRADFYRVVPLDVDKEVAVRAWRLWKSSKVHYDCSITVRGWFECTCADSTYRSRVCKHGKALIAHGLLSKEKE